MDIVDVGTSPSALSSSFVLGATRALKRACHCLAARSPAELLIVEKFAAPT
jgi:hypothetical protein